MSFSERRERRCDAVPARGDGSRGQDSSAAHEGSGEEWKGGGKEGMRGVLFYVEFLRDILAIDCIRGEILRMYRRRYLGSIGDGIWRYWR